ncbi:hypothetical protein [Vibrio lentus]|uniref:hypothetical protein n=1 Tax=Vibrio lentus TaxID=136468 RepID=UPI0039A67C4B
MLSISPLKSASGAAKYYLSEENPKDLPDVSLERNAGDNYYLKEKGQGENTFWHGKLAIEAGLAEASRASHPRVRCSLATWVVKPLRETEMIINRAST